LGNGVSLALAVLGAAGALIGSFQAIGARDLRRLGAYAGAAQIGCVLLSVAVGSPAGIASALVQIAAFAAAALCLFGGFASLTGATPLSALDGLGRRAPLAGAAITLGAISLMGAPLSLGFLGRWRLIEAAVNGGWWWAAAPAIIASLAAVFYGGRLIERIYFRRSAETVERASFAAQAAVAPALLVAMALIVLGLAPGWLLLIADHAARLMLGQGA
jgi:multicomponent Na+:H+ antiporter subunit D